MGGLPKQAGVARQEIWEVRRDQRFYRASSALGALGETSRPPSPTLSRQIESDKTMASPFGRGGYAFPYYRDISHWVYAMRWLRPERDAFPTNRDSFAARMAA